jgi:hypothetical protein
VLHYPSLVIRPLEFSETLNTYPDTECDGFMREADPDKLRFSDNRIEDILNLWSDCEL